VVGGDQGEALGEEPFGFKDGISMPRFFYDTTTERPYALDTKLEEIFLQGLHDHGSSFMVLRKLEQNVLAYRSFKASFGPSAAEKIVGREEGGNPLVGSVLPPPPHVPGRQNAVDYSRDPDGTSCPFHAHTRRMNPRSDLNEPRLHIVRRGVVYGSKADLSRDGPGAETGVGLLFMAYMSRTAAFDVMQNRWSQHVDFPRAPNPEKDLILFGPPAGACPGISNWVTPKGGAYFFVPSLDWMRNVRPD
jgi:Dyp-type peroxidase family